MLIFQIRQVREEEIRASEEVIRKLQEEELKLVKTIEHQTKQDEDLAKKMEQDEKQVGKFMGQPNIADKETQENNTLLQSGC